MSRMYCVEERTPVEGKLMNQLLTIRPDDPLYKQVYEICKVVS